MRLIEISDFSDTPDIHVDRPQPKYPHVHGGESGTVDRMSEELEHIVLKLIGKILILNPKSVLVMQLQNF